MHTKEQHISKKLQHTVFENQPNQSHFKIDFASVAIIELLIFRKGSLESPKQSDLCLLCVHSNCNKDFGLKSIKVCINARS